MKKTILNNTLLILITLIMFSCSQETVDESIQIQDVTSIINPLLPEERGEEVIDKELQRGSSTLLPLRFFRKWRNGRQHSMRTGVIASGGMWNSGERRWYSGGDNFTLKYTKINSRNSSEDRPYLRYIEERFPRQLQFTYESNPRNAFNNNSRVSFQVYFKDIISNQAVFYDIQNINLRTLKETILQWEPSFNRSTNTFNVGLEGYIVLGIKTSDDYEQKLLYKNNPDITFNRSNAKKWVSRNGRWTRVY